jgi:hypothetical protein
VHEGEGGEEEQTALSNGVTRQAICARDAIRRSNQVEKRDSGRMGDLHEL